MCLVAMCLTRYILLMLNTQLYQFVTAAIELTASILEMLIQKSVNIVVK